uniref:Nuclear transcription factor Y subunit n=1 Tax=Brugia timori TaxID=42155 RepID=A0A0R3QQI2_9BILA
LITGMSSTGRIFFISVRIEEMLDILVLPVELTVTLRVCGSTSLLNFILAALYSLQYCSFNSHRLKRLGLVEDRDKILYCKLINCINRKPYIFQKQLEAESQKINQPNRRRRKRQLQHAVLPKQAYIV